MTVYSADQLAGFLRSAGVSGEALTYLTAIGLAEQGDGNPGDNGDSHSPWQINAPSHPGVDVAKLDSDPLYAARVAYEISGGGSNFMPWTTYSGATPQGAAHPYTAHLAEAEQATGIKIATPHQVGTAAADSGNSSVSAASATPATPAQPATSSQAVLPSDARVVIIDVKYPVVLFDVGQGLFIKFSLTNPYQYKPSGNVEQMTAQQFNAMGTIVDGGDAAELAGLGQEGKTFKDQFEFVINNAFGGDNNPALKDPQVRQLVAEVTANEDLLNAPSYIQNRLRSTSYYQGSSDQKLKWNTLSDGEKQAEIGRWEQQLAGDWQQYVGNLPVDISKSDILKWAYQIAAGVRGEGSVLFENIMPLARSTDGSPLQRKEQQETRDEHQKGNDTSTEVAKLRDYYAQWGVPVTDQTLQQKAQSIVDGTVSEADVQTTVQGVAKTMYPWKDPHISTADAAQPYLDTYSRVMEKASKGVFDPAIQKALTDGTPLWQFEQGLKGTDDWLKTDNARQSMTEAVATAGKTMGFV